MKEETTDAIEHLREQGLRITQLRRELIDFILSQSGHWSMQEMVENVQAKMPSVGVATVYRTVNLLVEEHFVSKTMVEDGYARFEVTPEDHHDHMTCVTCGKIFEFENEQIERLQNKVAKDLGFELADHRMELFGNCLDEKCKHRPKKARKTKPKRA